MNYFKIDNCDITNGDGVRISLWLSGCSHKCEGCHNPLTWDEKHGKLFTQNEQNIIIKALEDLHIEGLTLTGGDPLNDFNFSEVLELCKTVKKRFPEKDIWVWSGFTIDELLLTKKEIFNYIDYIIDGKFVKSLFSKNLAYRGSSNQKRYKVMNGNLHFID